MNWIKNIFFKLKFRSGILPDVRSLEEKQKDYQTEELFGDVLIDWSKTWENWKLTNWDIIQNIEVQNQAGSSSCVANAGSLVSALNNFLEENKYLRMSARWIYSQRSNKPSEGMFFDNLGQILVKFGIIPEKLMASDGLNEEEMNNNVDKLASFETIAKIYKSGNYFYLQNNIDAVASILAKGKSVIIGVGFGNGEWNMEVPIIKETDVNYRHAIVALPYSFFNYQGKKSILIQDSWGINSGIKGRRIITEDWFNEKRIFTAMWFEDISNLSLLNSQIEKPKYKFTRILTTGMRGYDIAMLQRCLGYLKDKDGYLFPLITETTGYYGGITRKAVERYQQMRLLPITGVVDDETIIELNKDFK